MIKLQVFTGTAFTFTLTAQNDQVVEGAEALTLQLSNFNNSNGDGAIITPTASTDITELDADVTFDISSTTSISEENEETATFTITLGGDPLVGANTASVDIVAGGSATSGADFDNFINAINDAAAVTTGVTFDGTNTLTFDSNFVGATFSFSVDAIDDAIVEGTETITATLSNQTVDNGSAAIGIANTSTDITELDAEVTFDISSTASISEDLQETATFTITVGGDPLVGTNTASVDIVAGGSATSGTDFDNFITAITNAAVATNGVTFDGADTLTFDSNFIGPTFSFSVDAIDDQLVEGTETITATLSNQSIDNGSASIGTAITSTDITEIDQTVNVAITSAPASISEDLGESVDFTITLSQALGTGNSISVDIANIGVANDADLTTALLTTIDNDLVAGVTRVGNTITFDQATGFTGTAFTFTLTAQNDQIVEGTEALTLQLSNLNNSNGDGVITAPTASTDITELDADITFDIASTASISEDLQETATFIITVGGDALIGANTASVDIVAGGSATSGTDFDNFIAAITSAASTTAGVSFDGTDTLTFDSNFVGPTFSFSVDAIDDAVVEGTETITAALSNQTIDNGSASIGVANTSTDITEVDAAALTINDVNVNEDAGTATFNVTLNANTASGFTVDFNFIDGTATGGVDFDNTGGTLTFVGNAGEIQTITVPITDDVLAEGIENFTVELSNVSNPLVDITDTGLGSIADDVDTTLVSLTGPANVVEGEVTTNYTVSLNNPVPTGNSVTVNLSYSGTAIDGADFTGVTSVIINGPANSATFTLATLDDALAEGAETIVVDIDSIIDTNNSFEAIAEDVVNNQVTTVINDQVGSDAIAGPEDTVLVSLVGPANVIEGEVTTDFTVTLDTPVPVGNSVTVNLAYSGTAVDGIDFTGIASVVVSGPANSATFSLATIDDALAEGAENIIVDIDSIVDTNNSFEAIAEDAINNQVTTVINDQVGSDAIAGPEDTVLVSLVGPANVTEGDITTDFTVMLSETVPVGNSVTVNLAYSGTAIDGSDFNGVASVIVNGPANSATFTLTTLVDGLAEGAEDIIVDIDSIVDTNNSFEAIAEDAVNNQVTTTIADIDSPVLTVNDVTVSEADGTATFSVTLSTATVGGFTVDFDFTDGSATGGIDFDNTGGTLIFVGNAGEVQSVIVPINNDVFAEGTENFTLNLSNASNPLVDITDTGLGTINDDVNTVLVSLSGPANVIEGEVTTDYTVTLSDAIPAGNSVTVNLAYSGTAIDGTDFTGVTSVVVNGPANSATFTLATIDDVLADNAETIVVDIDSIIDTNNSFEAIAEDAVNNQVTTIINDEAVADTVTVSIAGPANVVEGEATTDYTVTLSDAVPAGNSVTINLSYSGTAIDGTDFNGVSNVVVNGPANSANFTLATLDDALAEGAENIVVDIDSIVDTK